LLIRIAPGRHEAFISGFEKTLTQCPNAVNSVSAVSSIFSRPEIIDDSITGFCHYL
jgi:hypothetical protein